MEQTLMRVEDSLLVPLGDTPVRIAAHSRGLFVPMDITFEDAERAMDVLIQLGNVARWGVIDLLVAAEEMWGEAFAQLLDETKISWGYYMNLRTLHARFPTPAHRKWDLSIGHYQTVVTGRLTDQQRQQLLDNAEKHKWNREQLRMAVANILKEKEQESDRFTGFKFANAVRIMVGRAEKMGMDREIIDEVLKYLEVYEKRV